MLLELRDLVNGLQTVGVGAPQRDDHLVSYPKRPLLFAELSSEGQVACVSAPDAERISRLLKYETSKGGARESTPGFNIDPLYRAREGGEEELRRLVGDFKKALDRGGLPEPAAREARLSGLIERCEPNWDNRAAALNKSLNGAAVLLAAILDENLPEAGWAGLRELLRRSKLLDAGLLHQQLSAVLRRQLIEGAPQAPLPMLLEVLFLTPTSLVLELDDALRYDLPANADRTWALLNEWLLTRGSSAASGPTTEARGAFGEVLSADKEKMPQVKLPRLGPVILRSLSKSIVCQQRYGLAEAEACPVGKEVRRELAAALSWLVQPEREGKTWADVSESCGHALPAVLLAYPDKLPADLPDLSSLMAGPARSDAAAASTFETMAHAVTESLRGIVRTDPQALVHVFVLAKADKARTKLLASHQYTVDRLLASAQEWQRAARNHPPIRLRQFGKAKGETFWGEPMVPHPGELVWCVNTAWLRAGTHAERVSALDFGAGLTLLLEMGPALRDCARWALQVALTNSSGLLLALGQAQQLKTVHRMGPRFGKQALLLPCVFGLLLAKLGCWRDRYVESNAYLIGRLLSLADRLHINYCNQVRDKEVPRQLLGNGLMATALDNPRAGLARLADRLPLYYRYAGTPLRDEVGCVERLIDKATLPTRCDDVEKAQMLLGYLARPEGGTGSEEGQEKRGEPK